MTYVTPEAFEYPVTWVCGEYALSESDCVIYCDEKSPVITLPIAEKSVGKKVYIKAYPGVTINVYTQEDDSLNGSLDPLVFSCGCYELMSIDWGMWETIAFSEV